MIEADPMLTLREAVDWLQRHRGGRRFWPQNLRRDIRKGRLRAVHEADRWGGPGGYLIPLSALQGYHPRDYVRRQSA